MTSRCWILLLSAWMALGSEGLFAASRITAKKPIVIAAGTSTSQPHSPKIYYRVIENTKAYEKPTQGEYVTIKVTPPKVKGPNEFVFVEIYNWTKTNLDLVEFDINLHNNQGYDLATHIVGDAMLAGYSGVKKIPTPGSGAFIPITKVTIDDLKIVNEDATFVVVPTYVDLIRGGLAPGGAAPAPAKAAPAKAAAPAAAKPKKK